MSNFKKSGAHHRTVSSYQLSKEMVIEIKVRKRNGNLIKWMLIGKET